MLSLAAPFVLILLPAPVIVWWLTPPHKQQAPALRVPFFHRIVSAAGQKPAQGAVVQRRSKWQMLCATSCWVLMVLGLARPEILGEPIVIEKAARDLVLAVDISGSMDIRDLQDEDGRPVQRLAAVKDVINDFIDEREGDRVALIVFGSNAYLQTPFTEDLQGVTELMLQTEVGMAGPHTAIGDAIGLSLRTFKASEIDQKLLVLLSDGADTNSQMSPINAAQIAAEAKVKIYTIAVGDPRGDGANRVDTDTLEQVATRTGGEFHFSEDTQALREIYAEIDRLNPRMVDTTTFQPRETIGQFAFAAAFCIAFFVLVGLISRSGRMPRDA